MKEDFVGLYKALRDYGYKRKAAFNVCLVYLN